MYDIEKKDLKFMLIDFGHFLYIYRIKVKIWMQTDALFDNAEIHYLKSLQNTLKWKYLNLSKIQ